MTREFKTPDPGEGIHEVEIVELYVGEGDRVAEGDPVMAVESDKATIDLPASFTGVIESIEVAEGDVVAVGDVLFTYAENGDDSGDASAASTGESGQDQDRADEGGGSEDRQAGRQDNDGNDRQQRDDQAQGERSGEKQDSRQSGHDRREDRSETEADDVEASPATRRLARELGVALADVSGSGPGGRVLGRDVRKAARRHGGGARASSPLPDFSRWGETSREPLRGIRRATARRMAESWARIPHVTHTRLADVTDLEAFRKAHVGDLEAKLTLTVLVVKALAAALRRFPRFNASLDDDSDEIVYKHYCHVGVAVATEDGLLVPVLRDADRKTLRDLAEELETLSERARRREISGDEMRGGCISVTNVGGVGGDHFTPIINYPEAAILGVGALREVPVLVRDGGGGEPRVEGRLELPLIVAFDHRLNDGMDAARFANAIAEALADPERLLLVA